MSRLYFECRFKAYKLRSLDLPIEIRKPNLTLVIRCRSSQSVELKAGTYYLIARLPTGQELYREIELAEDTDMLAILTSEDDDATSGVQETLHFLGGLQDTVLQIGQPESLDGESNSATPYRSGGIMALLHALRDRLLFFVTRTSRVEPVHAKLCLYRGNALEGSCAIVHKVDWLSPLEDRQPVVQRSEHTRRARWFSKSNASATGKDLRFVRFSISGVNSPQLIQLLQPHMAAINVMLPVSLLCKCSLVLKQFPNGSCAADIHLADTQADLLLRYLQEGLLDQGTVLAASEQQVLEAVLNLKWDDPIAAAVGAYALLRVNDLARLKDWTEDLSSQFAWLPDGIAIRGEYLARIGEHNEALTLLLDLPARGLPIFSDGFSYIIDRLRLYTQYGADLFESQELSRARALLERLQHFAFFIDFHRPLLTFNGIDPSKPENNLPNADIASYEGYDIAALLHPSSPKRRSFLAVIRDIRRKKIKEILSAYFVTYRAALLGIGVIVPFIATLVTLVFYLWFNLLPPPSFLTMLEHSWYVLPSGVFFTGVMWGILPAIYSSFVTPEKANPRSYRALKGRLYELENRMGISEFSEMQKKSLTVEERRRATRVDPNKKSLNSSALDDAYTYYCRVREEIEASNAGLRWMLGTGYIKAWKMLHHAEESLVQFEPVAHVIRGTIRTNVRIQNSEIGNRIPLLGLSRRAVKNVDSTIRDSKSATSKESDERDTPSNKQQVGARNTSHDAKQVFNKYRDNLWQRLVGMRKQLLGQLLVTGIATYVLLCMAVFMSNPTAIAEAAVCYIIGFIAGLIGPSYRALKRSTTIDDYGFSWTYMLASCLFSGLVAVFGLLAIGRLDIPNIFPVNLFAIWPRIFRLDQLVNLLIAAFFGGLSNLYFIGVIREVDRIEFELLRSNAPSADDVVLPISSAENETVHRA